MKKHFFPIAAIALLAALSGSCTHGIRINRGGSDHGAGDKVATLLDSEGWTIDTLGKGLVYYNFEAVEPCSNAAQIINVLELDLTQNRYRLEFKYMPSSSIASDVRVLTEAVAVVNATYEADISYIKTDGVAHSECPGGSAASNPGGLRWWKHEGAVCLEDNNNVSFIFEGTQEPHWTEVVETYKASMIPNIYSSSPMLINDYDPCGERFAGDYTAEQISSYAGEDYRRHQGVRHPRTVVAKTEDNDLLLITIDGRWASNGKAFGMSAKEVTQFLVHYFNPQYALNMDGGGSTSMAVSGHGDPATCIVNYPTDNHKFDHSGERRLRSFFIIKEYE